MQCCRLLPFGECARCGRPATIHDELVAPRGCEYDPASAWRSLKEVPLWCLTGQYAHPDEVVQIEVESRACVRCRCPFDVPVNSKLL
jgi:hypothetical protein